MSWTSIAATLARSAVYTAARLGGGLPSSPLWLGHPHFLAHGVAVSVAGAPGPAGRLAGARTLAVARPLGPRAAHGVARPPPPRRGGSPPPRRPPPPAAEAVAVAAAGPGRRPRRGGRRVSPLSPAAEAALTGKGSGSGGRRRRRRRHDDPSVTAAGVAGVVGDAAAGVQEGVPHCAPLALSAAERAELAPLTAVAGTPAAVPLLREVLDAAHAAAAAAAGASAAAPRPSGLAARPLPEREEAAVTAAFPYPLDGFQRAALRSLVSGRSVLVSAPTSGGKTACGEMAVYLALARRRRAIYTTPLKALSNQKVADFGAALGPSRVGLLTGDAAYRRDADVLVMTTEIYRNILYRDPALVASLDAVVLDEFHYMADPERGTVWEEAVIHTPPGVATVALSATVANLGAVRAWVASIHGRPTDAVVSVVRPVPLRFSFLDRKGLLPLFAPPRGGGARHDRSGAVGATASPTGAALATAAVGLGSPPPSLHPRLRSLAAAEARHAADRGASRRASWAAVLPLPAVVARLERARLLPAIIFVFSRAGCDAAAAAVAADPRARPRLPPPVAAALRSRLDEWAAAHPTAVGDGERLAVAATGVAAHHAGMLSGWKTFVETAFADGLLRVVFATETLAAGVNMPARATVISSLAKRGRGGELAPLSTAAALQMGGRAGRRGMDAVGDAVVLRTPFEGATDAARIVGGAVAPLESHFLPTYGMVLNLLAARTLEEARQLVEKSFGSFLAAQERLAATASAAAAAAPDSAGDASGVENSSVDAGRNAAAREAAARDDADVAIEAMTAVLAAARRVVADVDADQLRSYVQATELSALASQRAADAASTAATRRPLAAAAALTAALAVAPPGTAVALAPPPSPAPRPCHSGDAAIVGSGGALLSALPSGATLEAATAALTAAFLSPPAPLPTPDGDGGGGEELALLLAYAPPTAGLPPGDGGTATVLTAANRVVAVPVARVSRLPAGLPPLPVDVIAPAWRSAVSAEDGASGGAATVELAERLLAWRLSPDTPPPLDACGAPPPATEGRVGGVEAAAAAVHPLAAHPEAAAFLRAHAAVQVLEPALDSTAADARAAGDPVGATPWETFTALATVLTEYDYLTPDARVTPAGRAASAAAVDNALWLAVVVAELSAATTVLPPAALAGVLAAVTADGAEPPPAAATAGWSSATADAADAAAAAAASDDGGDEDAPGAGLSAEAAAALDALAAPAMALADAQARAGVAVGIPLSPADAALVEVWDGLVGQAGRGGVRAEAMAAAAAEPAGGTG
ncbi:hypothetical protein I4F81_002115 [Pyropia yezoensis]|uniref:Uncharacterized protein n=1 Tax=Pyropia yezoensis TaxID=2788 RepID=A0ACC3BP59_PYRYE|nr:hypothetical protein I4F81_002115 [Neopyropia yezoensis]